MSTYKHLQEKYPNLRHQKRKQSTYCVGEKKAIYRLEHIENCPLVDYQVDGMLISNHEEDQRKCDYLLLLNPTKAEWIQIFIELKGKNVEHGITQLLQTLTHPLFASCPKGERRFARLVASSYPSAKNNQFIEKAKISFIRDYHCPLGCMKSGQSEDFNTLRRGK